jgi:thymidylate kinase
MQQLNKKIFKKKKFQEKKFFRLDKKISKKFQKISKKFQKNFKKISKFQKFPEQIFDKIQAKLKFCTKFF